MNEKNTERIQEWKTRHGDYVILGCGNGGPFWFPTDEEQDLVYGIIYNFDTKINNMIDSQFFKDICLKHCEKKIAKLLFEKTQPDASFFGWTMRNFMKPEFTDNMTIPVTEEMVLKGMDKFFEYYVPFMLSVGAID